MMVGYYCAFAPLEILDAAGVSSVNLCGNSEETIPYAEEDLPKNTCPLVKSSYGCAVTDSSPYIREADLFLGISTCDGKKKMYELLARKKNVYILQIPQGVSRDYARKLWIKEIRTFIKYIETTFNITITDHMLRDAARKRNQLRRSQEALMELGRMTPVPVSGIKLYHFLESLNDILDVDEKIKAVNNYIKELKEEYEDNISHRCTNPKRILITGCPLGGVLEKIVHALENNGGCVVCYENCIGIKAVRCLVDEEAEDIVEAIADAYLRIGCAVMSPNIHRKEDIPKLAAEFHADGVLDVILQSCHTYMIESRAIRKLCDSIDTPYMSLETDYSKADSGQIETRVAAFIESL